MLFHHIKTHYGIQKHVEKKMSRSKNSKLLHHNEFRMWIKQLNRFIKEELDGMDEILSNLLKEDHDLPVKVTKFQHEVAKRMFGKNFGKKLTLMYLMDDYKKFVDGFTSYSIIEHRLRTYYIRVIQNNFNFDVYSGENNITELTNDILRVTDNWILSILENKKSREDIYGYIDDNFGGDEKRFMMVLLFMVINLIISAICLMRIKNGLGQSKHRANLLEIVSKIYYNHSLSFDQFNQLKTSGLVGGIAYRGMNLSPDNNVIKFLKQKKSLRGTSWTTDYSLAVHFAAQGNPEKTVINVLKQKEGVPVHSLDEFIAVVQSYAKKDRFDEEIYFFIDDVSTALSVHEYISRSKAVSEHSGIPYFVEVVVDKKGADNFTSTDTKKTIAVVLGYLVINDKTLLYLGEGAPEHLSSTKYLDQKELAISIPAKFKLDASSFDMVFSLKVKKSEVSFLSKSNVNKIIRILEDNGVDENLIKLIKGTKMTVKKLNSTLGRNGCGKLIPQIRNMLNNH